MAENFDTEIILKEILSVFQKYAIPVNTIALNISLSDQDFDVVFPHLKDYKAGNFYRSLVVNDIPTTLQAKRRIPFDKLVQWSEENVLPFAQEVATEVEQKFEGIEAKVHVGQATGELDLPIQYSYDISVECRLRDVTEIEGNTVELAFGLQQRDATSYPTVYGHVGWLVDEEGEGDFGLDTVFSLFPWKQEVTWGILDGVHGVKSYFQYLRHHLIEEVQSICKDETP